MWRLGNQVRCIIRISEKKFSQDANERGWTKERTNTLGCRLSSLPLARQLNVKRKKAEASGSCARVGFDLRRERTTSDLAAEEESVLTEAGVRCGLIASIARANQSPKIRTHRNSKPRLNRDILRSLSSTRSSTIASEIFFLSFFSFSAFLLRRWFSQRFCTNV